MGRITRLLSSMGDEAPEARLVVDEQQVAQLRVSPFGAPDAPGSAYIQ